MNGLLPFILILLLVLIVFFWWIKQLPKKKGSKYAFQRWWKRKPKSKEKGHKLTKRSQRPKK